MEVQFCQVRPVQSLEFLGFDPTLFCEGLSSFSIKKPMMMEQLVQPFHQEFNHFVETTQYENRNQQNHKLGKTHSALKMKKKNSK